MFITKLNCNKFKNHLNQQVSFSPHVNLIIGNNGVGKTNILDAIYYLSMTKSALNNSDANNVMHGEDSFLLEGKFIKNADEYNIKYSYSIGGTKQIKKNGLLCKKVKEHIGTFPIIFMHSDDIDAIKGSSELRRKIFDNALCQVDKLYLKNLLNYNKILKQRNSLLKQFSNTGKIDKSLIKIYDQEICSIGKKIYEIRHDFISKFLKYFINRYSEIVNPKEFAGLEYYSHLANRNYESQFYDNFEKDLILKYTSMGVHRDDYKYLINGHEIKKEGSQGQKKSFFIALRLALRDFIYDITKLTPILLMDDIFENLDKERVLNILELIQDSSIGQVIISHALQDNNIKNSFESTFDDLKIINLSTTTAVVS